jgi:hypothetical protein
MMIPDDKYVPLLEQTSMGRYGAFSIKILVAGSNLPDLKANTIWGAAYDAQKAIEAAIRTEILAADPEAQKEAKAERDQLLGLFLFQEPIFVEEIPNGYCSDWCCKHLPWFVITTKVGRFKIGWRKRVINIDWKETKGTKTAEELFPEENVTKGGRMIHAWSGADAKRYITKILKETE